MAKITYLLGAGASYYACPILEKQAEMMIRVANNEIGRLHLYCRDGSENTRLPNYTSIIDLNQHNENEYKILFYMGYFGEKAKEYGTIDTYARKLFLNNENIEYRLLKMSVSVFFDLWENFYHKHFFVFEENYFNKIDNRYKSLFSVLLDNNNGKISLNNDFKFITWNYDLQLEEAFRLFLGDNNSIKDFDFINSNYLKFKKDINSTNNDIFHLNGHRGFFREVLQNSEKEFSLNYAGNLDDYWKYLTNLYQATFTGNAKFDNYINYAWEHNLNDAFFQQISKILSETDVLVIIGYSFPAFNRKIDQFMLSKLNKNKVKKIIYQDPNAEEQLISNLFEYPQDFRKKIEIFNSDKSLKQFHLPNDYFIVQKSKGPSVSYVV